MGCVRAEFYGELYVKAVDATVKVAEGVAEEMRFRQAAEGKAHPLWLLGHLTMTMDMLVNHWMLGLDMSMPAEWGQTFGPKEFGGTPITTDAGNYSSWDTVMDAYKAAGTKAAAKIATLSDEDLGKHALGPMPDQFTEVFGVLNDSIPGDAVHDAYHRGQMALLGGLG
jgi:hypothetical protein